MINEAIEIIKNKLKEAFPQFTTDDYPEDFNNYIFTSPEGALLVRYDASSYTDPNTTDIITQDETLEIVLFIGLRYKKYSDCYSILDGILNSINGLNINGQKLYPKKRQYIKKIKRDFWWAITLNLPQFTGQIENLPKIEDVLWKGAISDPIQI